MSVQGHAVPDGQAITIVWLRSDLRVWDNPALAFAAHGTVIPVYLLPAETGQGSAGGAAAQVWLHHALRDLGENLNALGSKLLLRRGAALAALQQLAAETGATHVAWNRRYTPHDVALDKHVKTGLRRDGLNVRSFSASLINEPHEIANKAGKPFKVFTAFYKHCLTLPAPREVLPAPPELRAPGNWPRSDALEDLALLPAHSWAAHIMSGWQPGEAGAHALLDEFTARYADDYDTLRDRPGEPGVSRLSPYLHAGQLSAAQVVHAVREGATAPEAWVRQIYWRDFAHHLLFHFPQMPEQALTPRFQDFPWLWEDEAAERIGAWQRAQTGYPLIDAGMRELWHTGWMHNRVRMNVASFLVKHLQVHWRVGASWFWETLVDADLANNSMGWQWSAGCGVDAAPFFRIFNPVAQGERFDAQGQYVRRWIPELAQLPAKYIYQPWAAPAPVLESAGVRLGETYPQPIVDHKTARAEALAAFEEIRRKPA